MSDTESRKCQCKACMCWDKLDPVFVLPCNWQISLYFWVLLWKSLLSNLEMPVMCQKLSSVYMIHYFDVGSLPGTEHYLKAWDGTWWRPWKWRFLFIKEAHGLHSMVSHVAQSCAKYPNGCSTILGRSHEWFSLFPLGTNLSVNKTL